MTKNGALLPSNSTPWERGVANAMTPPQVVEDAIGAIRGTKLVAPHPTMLPFLVWEYGLDELTPYVPNLYSLINQGIDWQRLRGTVSSIAIGLAWIGYTATLEEASPRRNYWNSFQLRFGALPANDDPDLERIEGITKLSVPKRSQMRRGVFQYDVGPLVVDNAFLDGSMLERESGISVTQAGTLWSFGRTTEVEHVLTEAEGIALGNWIAPVVGGVAWNDLNIPWSDANFAWNADGASQRAATLSAWFLGKVIYVVLKAVDGGIIGYRRARAVHQVVLAANGPFVHNSISYAKQSGGANLYVEAMTQFDDASDVDVETVGLMVDPTLAQNVKPGALWLEPNELTGGTEIAVSAKSFLLRKTVREQIKILMRF